MDKVIQLLNGHRQAYFAAKPLADETGHQVPSHTAAWSQVLVSLLTGTKGIERKKGADLKDGSDVKAANSWGAIDVPRFNGVLRAGRKAKHNSLASLSGTPFLYFVLWDQADNEVGKERCRVWVVRPRKDRVFRKVAKLWYRQRARGTIRSDNFQLHPPIGTEKNLVKNKCGDLELSLFFRADWNRTTYRVITLDSRARTSGSCSLANG